MEDLFESPKDRSRRRLREAGWLAYPMKGRTGEVWFWKNPATGATLREDEAVKKLDEAESDS